jgi:hypothetical protein
MYAILTHDLSLLTHVRVLPVVVVVVVVVIAVDSTNRQ